MNPPLCPSVYCSVPTSGPLPRRVVRAGFFRRKRSKRRIQRYYCKSCEKFFSDQTRDPTYYQKKPQLNLKVRNLLCSQVSQRRCAILLKTTRKTVARKFRFMARQSAIANDDRTKEIRLAPIEEIQFDDLITSIHTKCKPASVSIAVNGRTREILGMEVSEIPARHPLVEVSVKKYGTRRDERPAALSRLFRYLKNFCPPNMVLRSDCDPEYPSHVQVHFPHSNYLQVRSRRARTAGFGELKRIGMDPLFSLNHTCAMLRANLNRLARKTWCTTKTKIGLILHLELYRHYHNTVLLPTSAVS